MTPCRSIGQVIGAVCEGRAAVGILPMPQVGDADPWWRHLLSPDGDAPRVIARLPFGARGNARSGADALAIGRGAQQETGADRTFFAVEAAADISRPRFLELLADSDLACTFFTAWEHGDRAVNLIELDGFVPLADPRLACFRRQLGAALHCLFSLGGYAVPLPPAALAPGAAKG